MANEAAAVAADSSITSSLGFTNDTPNAGTMPYPGIALSTSYGTILNGADEVRLRNATGPVDQREVLSYRARDIKSVNTVNKIYYPSRVQSGVEFGVRLDEVLRTKDSNGFIICDEPIVLSISFKAPLSSNMSNDILTTIFERAYAAVLDESGKPDWLGIMTGALNPLIN